MRLLLLLALLGATTASAEKPRLLVMDITPDNARERAMAKATTAFLVDLFADNVHAATVFSFADLKRMADFEGEKQLAGCSDSGSSCMAEFADALGARYIVFGNLGRTSKTKRFLELTLLDSSEARPLDRAFVNANSDDLFDALRREIAPISKKLERHLRGQKAHQKRRKKVKKRGATKSRKDDREERIKTGAERIKRLEKEIEDSNNIGFYGITIGICTGLLCATGATLFTSALNSNARQVFAGSIIGTGVISGLVLCGVGATVGASGYVIAAKKDDEIRKEKAHLDRIKF